MSNIRLCHLKLCTSQEFAIMVESYHSSNLAPVASYLEQIQALLYGQSSWRSGPYEHPDTCSTYDTF